MANPKARIRRARQAPSKRGGRQSVGSELAAGGDRIANGVTPTQEKKVALQGMINGVVSSPIEQAKSAFDSKKKPKDKPTKKKASKSKKAPKADKKGKDTPGVEGSAPVEAEKEEIVNEVLAEASPEGGPAMAVVGGATSVAAPGGGSAASGGGAEASPDMGSAAESGGGGEPEMQGQEAEKESGKEGEEKEGEKKEGEGEEKKEEEKEPSVPRSPEEDPNFIATKKEVKVTAKSQKSHGDPLEESKSAGLAADIAPSEYLGDAQEMQMGVMDEAEPELFDAETFKAKLKERIDAMQLPANEDEASDFENNNNVQEISDAASADAAKEQEKAGSEVEKATSQEPDPSSVPEREITPLPEAPIGEAPLAVDAKKAMPPKRPEHEVSKPLQDDADEVDAKMAEHDITEEQLENSNEPEFTSALGKKKEGEEHVQTASQDFRLEEAGKRNEVQETAQTASQDQIAGMHEKREGSLNEAVGSQETGGDKQTDERQLIATDIDNFYQQTKVEVENSLNTLETEVTDRFDMAAKGARYLFERHIDKRMTKYKDDRYSGWGVFNRIGDYFGGLPDEVNVFFVEGRQIYIDAMDIALTWIANHIADKLKAAKERIALGKQQVADYVARLDPNLQAMGKELASEIEDKFEALEQDVVDRQSDLIDSLADQYNEHLKAVDARIEEMKAANRGLFDMILDAIIGVIKAIINIAKMLMRLLAAVVEAIGAILSDPIGFLSNLIDGLVQGFKNFGTNIMKHLTGGLITWLTGAMGPVGITIPDNIFSLPGIFNLVMQILGLGWDFIRKLAVRSMGEKMVQALETGYEVFTALASNGISGIWEFIQDQFQDLQTVVMDAIKDMLITKVIEAGIKWIMGLLSPAGAFIKAAMAIVEIGRFFIERGSEIIELVNAFIDGIRAIANGNVTQVANAIEMALAKAIPIVIGFLASLLGITGLTKKVTKIIKKIRKRIQKAIKKILKKAKKAGRKLMRKGKKKSGKKVKDKDVEKEVNDEKKGKNNHKKIAAKIKKEMEKPLKKSKKGDTNKKKYNKKKKLAKKLEKKYTKQLKKGVKAKIKLEPIKGIEKDGDIDFEIRIGPNDLITEGSVLLQDEGEHGDLVAEIKAIGSKKFTYDAILAQVSAWKAKYADAYDFSYQGLTESKDTWKIDVKKITERPSKKGEGTVKETTPVGTLNIAYEGKGTLSITDKFFKELREKHKGDAKKLKRVATAQTEFKELIKVKNKQGLRELVAWIRNLRKVNHELFLLNGGDDLGLPRPEFAHQTSNGKAKKASVSLLSAKTAPGTAPQGDDMVGWQFISGTGGTASLNRKFVGGIPQPSQKWVRMHLVNENFGGLGKPHNLAPGTKNNNYTHLKLFEEKIKDFIKEKDGQFGVAGMEGVVSYYPSGKFSKTDNKYNVPLPYFGMGIESSMYAQYMDFTSWAYEKGENGWAKSSSKPAPDLKIENELPNWEAPKIPTTGTVTQGLLLGMADALGEAEKGLFTTKTGTVHAILTRHNYENDSNFSTRVEEFKQRAAGILTHDPKGNKIPLYDLTGGEFRLLVSALRKLTPTSITYK